MALANILGRETVQLSGNATASTTAQDFIIQGSQSDVLNFARKGNDLIVQMKNGRVHTIKNFAERGFDFNRLMLADHDKLSVVDFSKALTAAGDGIIDTAVAMHSIGAGLSTTALLAVLGATPLPLLKDSPASPSLVAPTVHFATDTAANDGLTFDNTLIFTGTADPNTTVEVFLDGRSIGTATTNSHGVWSFDYSGTILPDGTHKITAIASNAEGSVSPSSSALPITIDTIAPDAPLILKTSSDTGIVDDGITYDNTLSFSGGAEPNSTVELFIGNNSIGTTKVDANGTWSFDYTGTALADGDYTITARATDAAGNVSDASDPLAITIDTTAPVAPEITEIRSDTGTSLDGITADNTLIFIGLAETGTIVELFINDVSIGTTTASELGDWGFDYTGTTLANDTYTVTAIATDIAGNVSPTSVEFSLTVNAPSVTIDGDGSRGGLFVFTFSEAVDPSTFTEDDIIVANGILVPYTFERIDATTYQINVQADLGENNTNVAVSIAAGSVQTLDGAYFGAGENVTSLEMLFADNSLPSDSIVSFDTSHAMNAHATFYGNTSFNQDIGGWDVSNVTTMEEMFSGAQIFNQDISGWDTGKVTSTAYMFYNALAFNQSIGTWNVSKNAMMDSMFDGAISFNQNLNDWDTSSLLRAVRMFADASAFNGEIGE